MDESILATALIIYGLILRLSLVEGDAALVFELQRDTADGVSVHLKQLRDLLLRHLKNLVHIYDVQPYIII